MQIRKTTRRVGYHTTPIKTPKLKTQIGAMPKMKQYIKTPKMPGFPKGHVY